jgi:hypothetical protein
MVYSAEKMCKDLRSMQLFAEKVLEYRLLMPREQFRSFGFHQPNTEEGRKVYTVAQSTLYYFLSTVTGDAVNRALGNAQQLIQDDPSLSAVNQVVLVGEATLSNERDRIQELVENFQFTDVLDRPEMPGLPSQITLLPNIETRLRPIQKSLSYINEDPYWDPRRDQLNTPMDGVLQDRATDVVSWLETHSRFGELSIASSERSVLGSAALGSAALGSAVIGSPTEVQASSTQLQQSLSEPPAIAGTPMDLSEGDRRTGLERRQSSDRRQAAKAAVNGWWNRLDQFTQNALWFVAVLAGLGLLGWLVRLATLNLLDPNAANNQVNSPPSVNPLAPPPTPPPGSIVTSPPGATAVPQSPPALQPQAPQPVQPAPTLPVARWYVQSPSPYDGVNFRVGPGVGSRIMRSIPNGQPLVDEGRQAGDWREVSFNGQRGWVHRRFVR